MSPSPPRPWWWGRASDSPTLQAHWKVNLNSFKQFMLSTNLYLVYNEPEIVLKSSQKICWWLHWCCLQSRMVWGQEGEISWRTHRHNQRSWSTPSWGSWYRGWRGPQESTPPGCKHLVRSINLWRSDLKVTKYSLRRFLSAFLTLMGLSLIFILFRYNILLVKLKQSSLSWIGKLIISDLCLSSNMTLISYFLWLE